MSTDYLLSIFIITIVTILLTIVMVRMKWLPTPISAHSLRTQVSQVDDNENSVIPVPSANFNLPTDVNVEIEYKGKKFRGRPAITLIKSFHSQSQIREVKKAWETYVGI